MADLSPLMPRRRDLHPVPYDPDYKTSVTRSPNLPLLSLESTPSEETGPRLRAFADRAAR
jgi:protocatechuate 3,4-dioxygenase beta subunit